MNLWHDVPATGKNLHLNVIIEIPRGSKNKYEIDKETGLIKLDRAMKTSQDYPFDYGFVPQTLWEDHDALDVVLLTTYPLAPGILVEVRPIGIMHMTDSGEGDDKIIAVPVRDLRWTHVKDITDLQEHQCREMKHFFETYKIIEDEKVTVHGFDGAAVALEAIEKSKKMYQEEFPQSKKYDARN